MSRARLPSLKRLDFILIFSGRLLSEDSSLNPAVVYNFYSIYYLKRTKINVKRSRVWPIFKSKNDGLLRREICSALSIGFLASDWSIWRMAATATTTAEEEEASHKEQI